MTPQSVPSLPQRPAIVGHRGASAHAPENALLAFRRAIEDGAQLLECDVHLSADGQVVVMHDETIDRTAAEDSPLRTGAIGELTRAELDTVVLDEGERVPSLAELLEMLDERARPAVREDQRDPTAALMNKVNPHALDLGAEVRGLV